MQFAMCSGTSTVKRITGQLGHSTDGATRSGQTVSHSTSGYFFTDTGKKKVLIDGEWVVKPVRVLQNGVWVQKAVRYFNGTDWTKTVQ
jgi:hypothetical protein